MQSTWTRLALGFALLVFGAGMVTTIRVDDAKISDTESATVMGGTKKSVQVNGGCTTGIGTCTTYDTLIPDEENGSPSQVSSIACGNQCGYYTYAVQNFEL